jgi:5,10-methenyltetrahydrofolate synthetase
MAERRDPPASPPCLIGEVDPGYSGLSGDRATVMAWRRVTRERLIAARRALPVAGRQAADAAIAAHLDRLVGPVEGRVVSLYWPFRGEPDLRAWGAALIGRGARLALPVVEQKARPLVFRPWRPGDAMTRGIWNIPVPDTDARVVPDIVIAPVVGFDPVGYRLGYGGGYFDRTLAALAPGWRAIGVGHDLAALPTIHPLPHDVPLHAIVTPSGIAAPRRASADEF